MSNFLTHLNQTNVNMLTKTGDRDLLLKQFSCHPGFFVVPVIKASGLRCLLLEAARLFWLPDVECRQLLAAICIACKSKSDAEFIFLLSTHLLGCQTTIWRSTGSTVWWDFTDGKILIAGLTKRRDWSHQNSSDLWVHNLPEYLGPILAQVQPRPYSLILLLHVFKFLWFYSWYLQLSGSQGIHKNNHSCFAERHHPSLS